jgi:hypothetical protein
MPIHLTSGARLIANMLRKALVEAYVTAKGLGMQADALLVYTKQPFSPSSIWVGLEVVMVGEWGAGCDLRRGLGLCGAL